MTDEPPEADGPEPGGVAGAGDRAADGGRRPTATRRDEPWSPGERRAHPSPRHGRGPGGRGARGRDWSRGFDPRGAAGPRPAWLPDDTPWPPRRHRPWRGFGCLFGLLFMAGVIGLLSIGTTFVGRIIEAPGPLGLTIRLAATAVAVLIAVALIRVARAIRRTGTVLDALVEQAARVEAGDYAARVETVGSTPGPVRSLARGFNTMAARLETDEAQRRSLLADVTHELRTPLAVVQGSVEAILDGVHPADEAHLAAILEETRTLDRLIEDLRTLALSESGALSLHREPTDLGILVGDVATAFEATADGAGVELVVDLADDLPLLDVDPVRIREVVGNLVANALRHTPPAGRIEIAARRVADGGPGREASADPGLEITVRDTGSGIPADLLPHVFERFARGAGSTGSGLGLSIARSLVELHGGTIEAESPAGGGTQIRIRLPLAPPAGPSVPR